MRRNAVIDKTRAADTSGEIHQASCARFPLYNAVEPQLAPQDTPSEFDFNGSNV